MLVIGFIFEEKDVLDSHHLTSGNVDVQCDAASLLIRACEDCAVGRIGAWNRCSLSSGIGAEGRLGLADPEATSGSVDGLQMYGRGRTGGEESEGLVVDVCGGGQDWESGEESGSGVHFGRCCDENGVCR